MLLTIYISRKISYTNEFEQRNPIVLDSIYIEREEIFR